MVTMRPQPAASMSGTAAWTHVKVPVRLTAMILSHFSAVISSRGSKDSTPALVTSMPIGPSSERTNAKAASTDSRSATSTSTLRTRAPPPRSSVAAASAPAPFRSMMATSWPSATNRRATPSPIPEAPPVTTATGLTRCLRPARTQGASRSDRAAPTWARTCSDGLTEGHDAPPTGGFPASGPGRDRG